MSTSQEVSGNFMNFLNEAAQRVQQEFPGAQFFAGVYQPNIINFHYEYYFGTPEVGIKVTVNTNGGPPNFLIGRIPPIQHLQPIALPVTYSLLDAYQDAVSKGYPANMSTAPVFLENPVSQVEQYPRYWFMYGNSNRWIQVPLEAPHNPVIDSEQPVYPIV